MLRAIFRRQPLSMLLLNLYVSAPVFRPVFLIFQLQYHLYAPIGPHKEDILAYQRLAHDFFLPNDLREELQKKSEATRQVMLSR
jgi:hypothetical protein